jgi:hypothetical protein
MLKYLRGGLGGPPIFVARQSISFVVIRGVGSPRLISYVMSLHWSMLFLLTSEH